jgi:protein O-mannosyl-transferase
VPERSRGWPYAGIIAVAVVLVYANGLAAPFVLDDQASIVQNRSIRNWSQPAVVLASEPDSPVAGRPLVNLSFAVNHALAGLDVRGYRVTNVVLHLACALLVLGILRRTCELPRVRPHVGDAAGLVAFAVALIWALHPLNSEVVMYLSQRTESMMAFLLLLTLYAAIRAVSSRGVGAWHGLAIVSCGLGMMAKESMVVAPVLVALYDRVYVFDSWRDALGRRRLLYAGLALTWLVLLAMAATGPRSASAGFSSGVSAWSYLLNQAVMITRYLRLAVWPDSLVAFYGWPLPLTLGDVLPEAAFVGGLAAAALVLLFVKPFVGYLGAWFFITLSPTSSVVPIATEVGAERRMYLPLLALVSAGVLIAQAVAARLRSRTADVAPPDTLRTPFTARRIHAIPVALALIGVCAALATLTAVRVSEYQSSTVLARTVVERWPSGVAHHMLGETFALEGRNLEAVEHLEKAVALGNSRAGYALGIELFNAGRYPEAIERLDAFVRTSNLPYRLVPRWLEPPMSEVLVARSLLARSYAALGRWEDAAEQAGLVLEMAPSQTESRGVLADAMFEQQQWAGARAQYREYLQVHPNSIPALVNLGIAEIGLENLDAAIEAFERAVASDPSSARAHRFLAMASLDGGDFDRAARHAREAIALGADDEIIHDVLRDAERQARAR